MKRCVMIAFMAMMAAILCGNKTMAAGEPATLTVDEVFDSASKIEGFRPMEYMDDFGFPKEVGIPSMICHGNAEPRDAVLALLAQLPEGTMVYDYTDDRGKFDRMFLDKDTWHLLYVHIGLGGNDSVLILFRGGERKVIEDFISEANADEE